MLTACNCKAMQLHLDEIATKVAPGTHALSSLIRLAGSTDARRSKVLTVSTTGSKVEISYSSVLIG